MDIVIPEWLNEDFLKLALNEGKITNEDSITILEIARAVPKGTNYMSDIYRVKLCYDKHSQNGKKTSNSLIIKSPITGGLWELMNKFGILEKEVLMYKEYVPMLTEILNKEGNLMPKSFYSSVKNVMILEDLNFQGFKMVDRLKQLDFSHSALALKSLGKFHAASVKLYEKDPRHIKHVGTELFFNRNLRTKNEYLTTAQIELLLFEISKWPELNDYLPTLTLLRDKIWDNLVECFDCKEDRLNVINHGDFWVTNLLFKYDENNVPSEMKFIDLQYSRYTTPAIDLIYLFQGSVQEKIRIEKYDELLNIYRNSLNEHLEKFQCITKKLEESELRRTLTDCQFYEFYTSITLLPVCVMESTPLCEIKDMVEDDIHNHANNPFRKYLQVSRYKKMFIKRIIEEFSKQNWYTKLHQLLKNDI